jgi:hypothetical protein
MDKARVKYLVLGIVFLLIVSVGGSYAYWKGVVKGEGTPMTVTVDELVIVLKDATILSSEEVKPGWNISKTFTVENKSDGTYNYNISIKDLVNTFVTEGGLQYKITSTNGYNMEDYKDVPKASESTHQTLVYNVSIPAGVTQEYTIEFRYQSLPVDQSVDMGKTFSGTLSIESGTVDPKYLYGKLLADHSTVLTRTDFNTVLETENTKTLYKVNGKWTENGKDVYYFAGNALDNWIKFGKDANNNDLYWRIIRTNEDGSVRLLYVGTAMDTTAGYIGASAYNGTYNNPMYVGYMYGTSGSLASNRTNTTSSVVKTVVDNWYNGSINVKTDATGNKYDKYVSRTAIYCNDRANTGYNTENILFHYAPRRRLVYADQPSYKCGNDANGNLYTGINGADNADRFSASTSTTYTNGVSAGNGQLEYPVALMTADEIVFAGGKNNVSALAWYYYNSKEESVTNNNDWWLISPAFSNSNTASLISVYYAYNSSGKLGSLNSTTVSAAYSVRPVISLKSCTLWNSGDGSVGNPYEVTIDSVCASRDN